MCVCVCVCVCVFQNRPQSCHHFSSSEAGLCVPLLGRPLDVPLLLLQHVRVRSGRFGTNAARFSGGHTAPSQPLVHVYTSSIKQ